MKKKQKKLSEEHKGKIGEANKKKVRSPELRKRISETLKRKGIKPKEIYKETGEKHWRWKGGSRSTARAILERNGGLEECQICNTPESFLSPRKIIEVHHIDGNPNNNQLNNLGSVCSFCHFAIHDNGKNTRFVTN